MLWSHFAGSVLSQTQSCSFIRKSAGRFFQVSWRTFHRSFFSGDLRKFSKLHSQVCHTRFSCFCCSLHYVVNYYVIWYFMVYIVAIYYIVILFSCDLSPLTDNHCAPPDVTGLSERSQVASVRGLPRGYTHTHPSSAMDTADGESLHRRSNSLHLPLTRTHIAANHFAVKKLLTFCQQQQVSFHAMYIHTYAILHQIHECRVVLMVMSCSIHDAFN